MFTQLDFVEIYDTHITEFYGATFKVVSYCYFRGISSLSGFSTKLAHILHENAARYKTENYGAT